MSTSLLLTLKLDPATFKQTNTLRQQYFPPERNVVPAHIMLFHQLPGDQQSTISHRLQTLCAQTHSFPLSFPSLQSLGSGVALTVSSPPLLQLHQSLATAWDDWLIPQDRQPFRPHLTIQNKVSPQSARQLLVSLQSQWQTINGSALGLCLWRYLNGPWESAHEFQFTGNLKTSSIDQ